MSAIYLVCYIPNCSPVVLKDLGVLLRPCRSAATILCPVHPKLTSHYFPPRILTPSFDSKKEAVIVMLSKVHHICINMQQCGTCRNES